MAFWNLLRDPTLAKLVQNRDVYCSLLAPILSPKYALLTCGQVMVGCHVADGRKAMNGCGIEAAREPAWPLNRGRASWFTGIGTTPRRSSEK